ncbi:MAG: PEP-CTERM sorting domain-containing protein [Candidatus Thiodiazotropha endolucinida]
MKFRSLAFATITLMVSSNVNAATVYYIFDGTLENIDDAAGIAQEQHLAAGHTFRTVFSVDMQMDGTRTRLSMYPFLNRPYTQNLVDYSNTTTGITKDYFFVDLISQPLLHGNSWNDFGIIEENYGLNLTQRYINDHFSLFGNNSTDTTGGSTELTAYYQNFSEITIGKEFYYTEIASTGSGESYLSTTLYGSATLVNVTDNYLAPVPAPAAVWLFGSGFIGLAGFVLRKKP